MKNFDVKDHGVRENMTTGSVRDTQAGKPRFDLVPATCLTKLALHYGAGSEKYGDRNWEKGQPITRYMSSAERHFQYFKMGLTDENHLMACVWNLFCVDWTLDQIEQGNLPKELDDRTPEMKGGAICKNLFARIEENIKNKINHSKKEINTVTKTEEHEFVEDYFTILKCSNTSPKRTLFLNCHRDATPSYRAETMDFLHKSDVILCREINESINNGEKPIVISEKTFDILQRQKGEVFAFEIRESINFPEFETRENIDFPEIITTQKVPHALFASIFGKSKVSYYKRFRNINELDEAVEYVEKNYPSDHLYEIYLVK